LDFYEISLGLDRDSLPHSLLVSLHRLHKSSNDTEMELLFLMAVSLALKILALLSVEFGNWSLGIYKFA